MLDDKPGLHAILIGVSAYDAPDPGAPLRPFTADTLDGPARTVAALEAWLRAHSAELAAPLKSLRLLASPSALERAESGTLAACQPATRDAVVQALRDWRCEASRRKDDVALFYFAGHGIQRSGTDTVMLLQDFNQGFTLLERAVSLGNIYGGMGSTRGLLDLCRTQWFFADCCRSAIEALRGYELAATAEVFSPEANLADDRRAPIFLAANSGRESFTFDGQCTAFGADLLACLEGAGADQRRMNGRPTWVVTAYTLAEGMARLAEAYNDRIAQLLANYNRANPGQPITRDYQRSPVPTLVSDPVLRVVPGPPVVPCTFQPDLATLNSLVDLHFGPLATPPPPVFTPPFATLQSLQREAGFYSLGATVLDPSQPGGKRSVPAQPVWIGPPYSVLDVPI